MKIRNRSIPLRSLRHRGVHITMLLATFLAPTVQAQQNLPGLPDNLAEEKCKAEIREDIASQPGLPPSLRVLCNNTAIGSVFAYTADTEPLRGNPKALELSLLNNAQGALLAQRMSCANTYSIQEGANSTVILACRLTNGGWPHVVAIGLQGRVVRVADGPPTALPGLVAAVQTEPSNKAKAEWIDVLRETFKEQIPLVSPRELKLFSELVRAARAANAQGKHAESERLFREALSLQTRLLGEQNPAIADTLVDLALSLSNRGRKDEAEALFARADVIIQKSPKEGDRARLFTYYGFHAANHGNYDAALKAGLNAVQAWRKQLVAPKLDLSGALGGPADDFATDYLERGELGIALNLVANMALSLDDLGLATSAATEALTIFSETKGLPQWWKADALLTLGKISSVQGRLSAAETYLNAALQQRRQLKGDGPHTIQVLAALGAAYQREGLLTSSMITYREIFRLLKNLPEGGEDAILAEDLIAYGLAVTAYAKTLTDPAQVQGLYSEAFDAFKLIRPSAVEATVTQAANRLATTDPKIQELLDRIGEARRRRDNANMELSYETALPDDQRSRIAEDRLTAEKKRAEAEVLNLEQTLNQQFPDYASLIKPQPLSLFDVRQRLGTKEGVITFLIGRQHAFVTLIRRDGIHIGAVKEGEKALAESVAELRRALEIQAGSITEFNLERSHQLYKTLFGDVEDKLQGLDHLIVAPAGPLASLPFGILITQPPASKNYTQASWLIKQSMISHTPSLQAFFTLRSIARGQQPSKKLLAVGNPTLSGKIQRGSSNPGVSALATSCRSAGPAPADLVSSLAPLPETEGELKSVAKALRSTQGDTVLLGRDATEQNLRTKKIEDYRVLYFATHGLLPGELKCQAEPALVLTPPKQSQLRANDGLLEASEVATLRINADLVVLSACNTAGGGGRFGGDALSGLAESFFFAGARNLLVSHWQVPSAATAALMSDLFEDIGPELDKGASAALQSAQKKMIAVEKNAHPFFWGAFVLIGDGAADRTLPVVRGNRRLSTAQSLTQASAQ